MLRRHSSLPFFRNHGVSQFHPTRQAATDTWLNANPTNGSVKLIAFFVIILAANQTARCNHEDVQHTANLLLAFATKVGESYPCQGRSVEPSKSVSPEETTVSNQLK
ncbi:MAG: hypothetical protein NTW08_05080 [Gammaproteobacteria bacterium]|nr:hypothetical protein [Gammaproteobacteria bacterium]